MNRNGYNTYRKKGLGCVKIGRHICPLGGAPQEEDRCFWENLKTDLFDVLTAIYQRLRLYHVSYRGIVTIMELIFPMGKDTIYKAFADSVEKATIPPVEDIRIVLYEEQHPKKGRTQKYRLTLLDGVRI